MILDHFQPETNPQELRRGIHYRKWIYILYFGNANDSHQLERLRQLLAVGNQRRNYHHFAVQIQRVYKVLSKDVHSSGIRIKYVDKTKVDEYIKFFSTDVRSSVRTFLNADFWKVEKYSSFLKRFLF